MSSSSKPETLDLTSKRSGKLQDFQAYLKMKKSEVGPIISERYQKHKSSLKPGERAQPFIKFQAQVAKELLAAEPHDVRLQVDAYRELEKSQLLTPEEILE